MILKLQGGTTVELRIIHFQNTTPKQTIVAVICSTGLHTHTYSASAVCNPSDNYNKAIGRKVALARAMRDTITRDLRTEIWEAYWKFVNDAGKHS